MKVAVDIDGTITRWPAACKAVLDAFPDAVILTGNIENGATQEQFVTARREQLRQYIGETDRDIVVCVGCSVPDVARLKGEYCRDNSIGMLLDDSDIYLDAVAKISPATSRMKSMQ